ncbi:hypothetical protein ACROYT_G005346 [Oculina patagonica]
MAESLLKYVSKRRNRSSDSSTDRKMDSPAMKKVKSTSAPESSPPREEHGEHNEDSDLVLTALELTDDVNGTLKCILEKLKKLDTIENAVKQIEGSLDKLERRTGMLEEFEKTAREDIDNLKSNHMPIEKKQDDDKTALDKKIKGIEGKIAELKVKGGKIDQTLKDLNTKDLYLEAYSRRKNIKFNNIPEFPSLRNGLEDTEEVLRSFLEKQLGNHDANSVEIQRVHRLGRKKEDGGARPILARFLRFKDCEKILGLGSRLRGTNFQMFMDLPQELVTRRREQMDTFKMAKQNNIPVSFSKSKPDKLYVRAEMLAKTIRSNREIKGFYVDKNEVKLSQYADDTTLILDGSKESLVAALQTLDDFSKISGLRLNDSKTEALWIGSETGQEKIYVPGKDLKWPKAPLHSNHHAIKEINDLFYHFLWNGKGDKIKRKIMINDPGNGGLKMIDLCSFNKSLKTTWVKKYLDTTNKGKWKLLFDMKLKNYGCENLFRCNLNVNDTKK